MNSDSTNTEPSTTESNARRVHGVTGKVVIGTTAGAPPMESTTAERWGAAYAARRGLPMVLMGTHPIEMVAYAESIYIPALEEQAEQAKESELARLAEELVRDQPGLDVATVTRPGHPGTALVDASKDAELVVVGTRGLDGWTGLLLGSTSHYLVTHARGPVAVIPSRVNEDLDPGDPIVLGVDGASDHSATEFAFEEARALGRPLHAVHSYGHGHSDTSGTSEKHPASGASGVSDAHLDEVLERALAPFIERYSDVEVERIVVRGASELALLGASARAAMLVLGSRGRGELRSVLFGSTSMRLLGRASCPVVVVPDMAHEARA